MRDDDITGAIAQWILKVTEGMKRQEMTADMKDGTKETKKSESLLF